MTGIADVLAVAAAVIPEAAVTPVVEDIPEAEVIHHRPHTLQEAEPHLAVHPEEQAQADIKKVLQSKNFSFFISITYISFRTSFSS